MDNKLHWISNMFENVIIGQKMSFGIRSVLLFFKNPCQLPLTEIYVDFLYWEWISQQTFSGCKTVYLTFKILFLDQNNDQYLMHVCGQITNQTLDDDKLTILAQFVWRLDNSMNKHKSLTKEMQKSIQVLVYSHVRTLELLVVRNFFFGFNWFYNLYG